MSVEWKPIDTAPENTPVLIFGWEDIEFLGSPDSIQGGDPTPAIALLHETITGSRLELNIPKNLSSWEEVALRMDPNYFDRRVDVWSWAWTPFPSLRQKIIYNNPTHWMELPSPPKEFLNE